MKNIVLKVISAALCCLLLATSLTACAAGRPIKGSDEDLAVVGTVKNYEVLYEELRYVTLLYRDQLQAQHGEGIWDDPATAEQYRGELEELVKRNITANYATLSLCSEVGITPDRTEIKDAVSKYIDELITEIGGRGEYKKALAEQNLTDHFLRFTIGVEYCQNELYYSYTQDLGLIETDEDVIYDYIMDGNFVRTVHVYIQNDPTDDIEANRAAAQDVHKRLSEGEDINKIIGSSVNEDFDLTTTHGYYFTRGEMITAYEDAAFALEIGKFSDVVETSTGFYIIKRLELEPSYVMQNLLTLIDQYQYSQLNKFLDDRQAELVFEFNDFGAGLDLTKIS